MNSKQDKKFKILVLDGGGSKGIYTLGVLKELENELKTPLYNHFDLIYGTSTGSIIGSLIGLGYSIDEIKELYLNIIPKIMKPSSAKGKSKALCKQAKEVYSNLKFDSFKTNVGIVALNFESQNPLIFKTDIALAHGMKPSFTAGFNKTISEAVRCSCSAYPFFKKMKITTDQHGEIEVIDGGFIANNSTLYSIVDAYKALGLQESDLYILNVGVGNYQEKKSGLKSKFVGMFGFFKFVEKVLTASTNSNTIVAKLLFKETNLLRISDSFPDKKYETNMFESDQKKLKQMYQLGRNSYAKYESEIIELLEEDGTTVANT
jgi:predicted patatin/cPLA2 family phospholipase